MTVPAVYREQVQLATGTLGMERISQSDVHLHVAIPRRDQAVWNHYGELLIGFTTEEADDDSAAEPAPLLVKLREQLAQRSLVMHGAPLDQPESVHELSPQIYAPYTVENGRAHLSGCSLEPRPFLRVSWPLAPLQGRHWYFDRSARAVDQDTVASLAMQQLTAFPPGASLLEPEQLESWIATAKQALREEPNAPPEAGPEPTVVWCRYASGKLTFEIGSQEVSLQFEGWAREIATGKTSLPPYRCPHTGRESYHLVADDEGDITAAEAIAQCEVSGARVMETKLEICQETGRRALKEYLATCEQTHRRVLKSTLQQCEMCRRQLASASLAKGRCEACRHLTPVSKDDPTLARLLHQYSRLDAWNRWRIGETPRLFIFTAARWTQRLLVVVEKQSLEMERLAIRSRFASLWMDCPPKQWQELTK